MSDVLRDAVERGRQAKLQRREEAERHHAWFESDEAIRFAALQLRNCATNTCRYADALWPHWDPSSGEPIPVRYWQVKGELLQAVVAAINASGPHAAVLASLEPNGEEPRNVAIELYRAASTGDLDATAAMLRYVLADDEGQPLDKRDSGPREEWIHRLLPNEIRAAVPDGNRPVPTEQSDHHPRQSDRVVEWSKPLRKNQWNKILSVSDRTRAKYCEEGGKLRDYVHPDCCTDIGLTTAKSLVLDLQCLTDTQRKKYYAILNANPV